MYVSPLFLIRSCVNGHYGCLQAVAVVSRTAVNFVVPVPFSNRLFSFDEPLYMSLVGGLPDQKLSLSLGLEGPCMLSPLWLLPIYCRGIGGFCFFQVLFCIYCLQPF